MISHAVSDETSAALWGLLRLVLQRKLIPAVDMDRDYCGLIGEIKDAVLRAEYALDGMKTQ